MNKLLQATIKLMIFLSCYIAALCAFSYSTKDFQVDHTDIFATIFSTWQTILTFIFCLYFLIKTGIVIYDILFKILGVQFNSKLNERQGNAIEEYQKNDAENLRNGVYDN